MRHSRAERDVAEIPTEVKQELESTLDSVDHAEDLVMRTARESQNSVRAGVTIASVSIGQSR